MRAVHRTRIKLTERCFSVVGLMSWTARHLITPVQTTSEDIPIEVISSTHLSHMDVNKLTHRYFLSRIHSGNKFFTHLL